MSVAELFPEDALRDCRGSEPPPPEAIEFLERDRVSRGVSLGSSGSRIVHTEVDPSTRMGLLLGSRIDLSKVVESAGSGPGGRQPSWSGVGPRGVPLSSNKSGRSNKCSSGGVQFTNMNMRATVARFS